MGSQPTSRDVRSGKNRDHDRQLTRHEPLSQDHVGVSCRCEFTCSRIVDDSVRWYHGRMTFIDPLPARLPHFIFAVIVCLVHASGTCCAENQTRPASDVIAVDSFDGDWKADWKFPPVSPARPVARMLSWPPGKVSLADGYAVEISGTGDRNNPLRRVLAEPFGEDEFFVRFLIQYDAESIDTAGNGDGEFFVMWFDENAGGDTSTHSNGVPNIGIHVENPGQGSGRNVFMGRVGPAFVDASDVELKGDRTFLVVGRLSKTVPGVDSVFDSLELWVDPEPDSFDKPVVTALGTRSVSEVRAIGFSTGRKTEPTDRIWIDELILGRTWESVLGLPPRPERRKRATPPVTIPPKPEPPPVPLVNFRHDVYPILKSRCFECHSGPKPSSSYRLDVLDELLGHSTGEPLAEPGKSTASRLIALVSRPAGDDERMPPPDEGQPLTADEIDVLTKWIDEGLAWDDSLLPPAAIESDHWAFQRIERPVVPMPPEGGTPAFPVRTPVDAFLAQQYEQLGLRPVGNASKRTLVRRLALDLTGLPLDPVEVDAVVNDPAPDAIDRLIRRLLASPAYGERWGRHWLDVARFAESNGYQHNRERPHAWRYRDYVVESFNNDKPFDQFLLEQIAGDELEPYTDENLIATGFLAAARYSGNEKDKSLQRNDILVDITNATGSALLGLTFGCAQCHNHKFDPLSARDYYRFQAFFTQGQPVNVVMTGEGTQAADIVARRSALFDRTYARLYAAERRRRPKGDIFVLPKTVVNAMPKTDKAQYTALGNSLNSLPQTWSFYSPVTAAREMPVGRLEIRWPLPFGRQTMLALRPRLLVKGDPHSPGPVVSPGWPAVFGPVPGDSAISDTPRSVLARWLTSRDNPLTARVLVNRIWQWHFGHGLVEDAGNFGVQTPEPPARALLDWLAVELIESGWSVKHLHRLIVNSNVYRRGSRFDASNERIDPDNRLFWRWMPRRLEAEAIRDSLLVVSHELSPQAGGRSLTENSPAALHRRSLYLLQKRKEMPRMQDVFDGPSSLIGCNRRQVSTVPLQPLFLLNSPFAQERARRLSIRISSQADSVEEQISLAFRIVLGRPPDAHELHETAAYLASDSGDLKSLCVALLNTNEFVYLP